MVHSRIVNLTIFLWVIFLIFTGCQQPAPYGDLNITVYDDRGNPVDSAEITLYRNKEDYNQEQNPFTGPLMSDQNGKLTIFSLTDTVFYVDVVKGGLNNWENDIKISIHKTENGFNNTKIVILSDSKTGILSSAQGKTWKINSLSGVGRTVVLPLCFKDNLFTFYKSGVFEQKEGAISCHSGDPDLVVSSDWYFNTDETETLFDYTQEAWNIITINRSEFRVVSALNALFPNDTTLGTQLVDVSLMPQ